MSTEPLLIDYCPQNDENCTQDLTNKQYKTIYDLNKDEMYCILQFLDLHTILVLSEVNKKFYNIASN